jgi:hypothetical protein
MARGGEGENLVGPKLFTFTNPSGSSYFTMETIPESSGFYEVTTPKNFEGTYVCFPINGASFFFIYIQCCCTTRSQFIFIYPFKCSSSWNYLLFKRNRNVFSYYFLKFTWPPNILFVYYYYKQIKIKVMLSREKIIKTLKISSIGILIGAYFMTGLYGLAFVAGLIVGDLVGDKIFKD